ncbi:MAG TPA: oligosaccharide flippase family protein [Acidobacteriaceae bacterium]|nr:oligosaccharide flippase family protein [Acidobacteriaceae bacterium]
MQLSSTPLRMRQMISRAKVALNPTTLKGIFKSTSDRGKERYRKAGITASASLIQKALTIVISFVSVPLTVHYLGPERYGVWLTISSLLVWMAMTDFGLAGNALVNVLSEADGKEDQRAAQEYTSSTVWALTGIAAVFAIVAVATFRFIPWSSLFKVTTVAPHELALACALTLGFFIIGLPLSVQNSIYSAYQDGFLSNAWGISMNVSSLVALVIVTRFHGGLPQLVMALSGVRTLLALINVYYMFFKRYRWLVPAPSAVRWYCIRRLFKLGAKYFVIQLGSLGMYQSQPMIITQILGPAKVMVFVVAQKIITLPMDLVYMMTVPFIPAFGEAKARDDWKWIKRAYRNATLVSVAGGVPVLLAIAMVAKPLIRVWAGAAAVPDTSLIVWLSVYNVLGVILMATGQFLIGVEQVNSLALSITLCALSTIGFGVFLGRMEGLSGVAMAMAASKLLTFWPIQLWAVRRIFAGRKVRPLEETSQAAA